MAWEVEYTDQCEGWCEGPDERQQESVVIAVELLGDHGPEPDGHVALWWNYDETLAGLVPGDDSTRGPTLRRVPGDVAERRTELMPKTKPFAELAAKAKADPVRRARIALEKQAIEDALTLAELRSRQNVTQQKMANALGVMEANISRIEHEEDLYLSTLRGYVAALGGELEVNAVFPDGKVRLVPAKGSGLMSS